MWLNVELVGVLVRAGVSLGWGVGGADVGGVGISLGGMRVAAGVALGTRVGLGVGVEVVQAALRIRTMIKSMAASDR